MSSTRTHMKWMWEYWNGIQDRDLDTLSNTFRQLNCLTFFVLINKPKSFLWSQRAVMNQRIVWLLFYSILWLQFTQATTNQSALTSQRGAASHRCWTLLKCHLCVSMSWNPWHATHAPKSKSHILTKLQRYAVQAKDDKKPIGGWAPLIVPCIPGLLFAKQPCFVSSNMKN